MATPKRILKPLPVGGLRSSWPSDQLRGQYSPNCRNVRFRFGEVIPTPGRAFFDNKPAGAPAGNLAPSNIGMAGSSTLSIDVPYMFATSRLYERGGFVPGSASGSWIEITPAAGGSVKPSGSGPYGTANGEDRLFLSSRVDLPSVGLLFGFDLSSWIVSSSPPTFTQVALDAGYQGPSGGNIHIQALALGYINGHTLVANISEFDATAHTTQVFPMRVRWSQSGDYTKWNEALQLGAGFVDLMGGGSMAITGGKELNNDFVVYKRDAIIHMVATGQIGPEFIPDTRVRGIGTRAPFTVASNGQMHFFLGTDGSVYSWNGYQLQDIGVPIKRELAALLDFSAINPYTWIGATSNLRNEYWLLIRSTGAFNLFIYDWIGNSWTRDTIASLTALGEIITDPNLGSPNMLLLGANLLGQSFAIDDSFVGDFFSIGSVMDKFIETDDMYLDDPGALGTNVRLILAYVFVTADPFEVGYSTNRGVSYTTLQVTPSAQGYSIVDFGPITSNVVRFRFRENNANGSFRWQQYTFEYLDAGKFIGTTT